MSSLAILILTCNEEDNIVSVVENAKKCTDEVVVIDSGSTDRTVELAKEHGAKVAFSAWTNDFSDTTTERYRKRSEFTGLIGQSLKQADRSQP